jgi:poly(3-hydroxybutyrate) depolymerase
MRAISLAALGALLVLGCDSGKATSSTTSAGGSSSTIVTSTASHGTGGTGSAVNRPPAIESPGDLETDEDKPLQVVLKVSDPDGDPLRVSVDGLPPGALWDEASRSLSFTPDFIQGGASFPVTATVSDGKEKASVSFAIKVNDTIVPPPPSIAESVQMAGYARLTLSQKTDDFLDSPGYAGRSFKAVVTAPAATTPRSLPVRVVLHGFGGSPWQEGWTGEFRIAPHDPDNTYWWGYADGLPGAAPAAGQSARDYTVRRVLALLEWVLKTYPAADPERVYLDGASMGGAGAMTIGMLHARHFAWVNATIGQAIPRNHRPERIAQLTTLWGSPSLDLADGAGMSAWDRMDLTRAAADDPEARTALLHIKHGKDDPTIHFGAVVIQSPLTHRSFYGALQEGHIGHLAVWDEGAHGPPDPVLGDGWWQKGWNPIFDDTAFARRNLAFPAFTRSSADDDPGDGSGNGKQPWSASSGYAGQLSVPGDTGWNGEIAGALNRFLRWDATKLVDTFERFELPLRVLDGAGGPPPQPGYPTTGDKLDANLPVKVDVTPRRVSGFRCKPGEKVAYTFGATSGEVTAGKGGEVTIPALPLTTAWTTLEIRRM